MHVLIADAQKDVGGALAGLVERCGHEVLLVVASGLDTIQAHARLKPDLVLMDYAMPRLNGATAARMILAKDPAAKIVIISATPGALSLADTGAIAILPKPVEMHQLYAALYDAASHGAGPS